jgi:hypothetical protein
MTMTSCKSSKTGQKSVSFSQSKNTLHEIENLDDFTEQERSQIWFNREEYSDIKARYRHIIEMMRKKQLLSDTDEHCTRGLECRSIAGSKRRRDSQRNGLVAVLGEQDRQRADGVNEETLAIVYRQFAYHSQQAATNMGRRDQQAITEFAYDLPAQYLVGLRSLPVRAARMASPTRRNVGISGRPRIQVSLGGASRRRATAA